MLYVEDLLIFQATKNMTNDGLDGYFRKLKYLGAHKMFKMDEGLAGSC